MKTKILSRAVVFLTFVLMLAGCVFDNMEIMSDNAANPQGTMEVVVNMPDNTPRTKLSLLEDEFDIHLTWEAGDKIYFVFTQDDSVKGKQTVTLTEDDIQNDGKKAVFILNKPDDITEGNFNLYGVCGGTGFSIRKPTPFEIDLSNEWYGTLEQVKDNKALLLRFEATDIPVSNPSVSGIFEHVGSLFHLALKNIGNAQVDGISKVILSPTSSELGNYCTTGGTSFHPVTGLFSAPSYNTLEINVDGGPSFNQNEIRHFWAWWVPSNSVNWPGLKLIIETDNPTYSSENAKDNKPARTSPTETGKAFHFFAVINIDNDPCLLKFTEPNFIVYGELYDNRDGNKYKTVEIGNQTWMAENLAYLPAGSSVSGPESGCESTPHYYVYGFDGGTIVDAKAQENYKTYGVLYNWPAARIVCPPNWHLPTDNDWNQLVDDIGGQAVAGGKMKETGTAHWIDPNTEATNESGFTALPGGFRSTNNDFFAIGETGLWCSATLQDNNVIYWNLTNYSSKIFLQKTSRDLGFSVRCVRD